MAVGELLDAAFTLYRRNARLILVLTAVVQVPLALFNYLAFLVTGYVHATNRLQELNTGAPITTQQLADLRGPLITVLAVTLTVLLVESLVVQPVATAAMTRAVGDVYLDQPVSVGSAYRAVGRRLGSVLAVALILFAAAIGLVAAAGALIALVILALGGAGGILLVVIIPGAIVVAVVVYTRWLFAGAIVILERASAGAALRRSWQLVRGSTLRVFGIVLLVGIITAILSAVVTALLSVATGVGDDNVRLILNQLATLVVAVLIRPITFIVIVLLYYDLRIRREAFDIEMLAATL